MANEKPKGKWGWGGGSESARVNHTKALEDLSKPHVLWERGVQTYAAIHCGKHMWGWVGENQEAFSKMLQFHSAQPHTCVCPEERGCS